MNTYYKHEIQGCKFYRAFLCCKPKNLKEVSLKSRMEKVYSTFSIKSYIQIYDEFKLLKKILFEKDQIILFELISKLENSNFKETKEHKPTLNELFQSLQNIMNNPDSKTTKLIKFLFQEDKNNEIEITNK